MLKTRFSKHAALVFVLLIALVPAESRADTDEEIHHLLLYIDNSSCAFIRNDTEHTAAEARKHIEKKYNYFKKRVKTAEDFIEHAATESSLSGRPYRIACDGQEMLTAEWLTEELQRFRARRARVVP